MLTSRLGRVVMMSAAVDVASVNEESTGAWVCVPKQRLSEMLVEAVRRIGLAQPGMSLCWLMTSHKCERCCEQFSSKLDMR